MSTKDVTDAQVVRAYLLSGGDVWPYHVLAHDTGQPFKVCYAAMGRAARRGLIDYGVSLRSGWVTEKGMRLLRGET